MRNLAFLSLLVVSCIVCTVSDSFSRLNESLKNDSAIRFYANCFLDKGPCSGDGRAVKWLLPDLVASSCDKCSVKQKRVACRIVTIMQQKKYADIWEALLKKYDPKKIHRKHLDGFNKNCESKFKITIPNEEAEATTASSVATIEASKNKSKEKETAAEKEE